MTPTDDPTPTADAIETWLADVARVGALIEYPGAPEDLDPPPWVMEADNYLPWD